MKASVSGRKLALAWILALSLSTVLALGTFKTRLVSEGMAADQALARASAWEAVHILLVGLIPAGFLVVTLAYLRAERVADWTVGRILVVWLAVPIAFYFVVLMESVLAETILPLDNCCVLPLAYGICFILVAAATVVTLHWNRNTRT
jgi:hypothetical protein